MPQAEGASHWWPTFGVMLGALTVSLNIGVLNVAVPSMMSSLSTDLDRIQWVQTGYQIVQAVLIPAVGWLGTQLGTKRLFVLATLFFIAGSALCGLAWDVHSLIFFRILQGIGGGPITPLGMSILYSTFPPDKRGLAMGLYNFSFSFGPAIAPALGGHLIEVLNWRAIFYINVPVGLLSAVIVLFTMPTTQEPRARSFDAVGVFTMASFLILLLLGVSEGRRYGWGSQMIVTLFLMSGVGLVGFVVAELNTKQPFVEVRLYKNIPFMMGCLIAFLNTLEFRGTSFLLPIMLQRIYHYTPFQAGLFFLPPALVMGTTSIIAGRLSDKLQPKLLLALGLLMLTYVSFQFCGLDVWATTGVLLGLIVLRRGAQAFCHSPLTSSTLRGVPEDQVRMASGLFSLHRTLAGAVGVAVTATLMDYREDVHTLILSQRQALYPLGTEVATDAIRGVLMQDGERGGMLAEKTAGVLRQKLSEEAALAGYHDLFYMFAALTLFSLIPVLFMRGGKSMLPAKAVKRE
ncbi:MAG TPA: DHA2 family efflux MFS transporter permease subunit [Candidatus Tectomicrobia bacterium]|nr:DHA2 family efflux MFS transporter permease subunit [Candidatus Tectomicrobia bacterium]